MNKDKKYDSRTTRGRRAVHGHDKIVLLWRAPTETRAVG